MKIKKLWGERFEEMPTEEMVNFLSGRDVKGIPPSDEPLIPYDLWGSRAHVLMLYRQKILSQQVSEKILKGLKEAEGLYQKGKFRLDPSQEDVHSNTESFLIRSIGIEFGGRVHTGRSRNDQIVLDMRLYLRDKALGFVEGLIALLDPLLRKSEEHQLTLLPGYTHHQHAVPTTFGHLLLSFAEGLERDVQRFVSWFHLFNKNPLGAAAGFGTSFNLDRGLTSKLMGFDGPAENITDPVTQRWEPEAELAYAVAVMMNHLSTMAQTFILLSTSEFGMVRLNDRHCSGSSIMPQKRNPDSLEVIKGKASFTHGMVMSLLSAGKALFAGYNRDTQWTKYWVMDIVDESQPALAVMSEVIRLLQANRGRMREGAEKGFSGATALMEWIVLQGFLPLRKAKIIVEKAVKYSDREGKEQVSYQSLKKALAEAKIDIPITEKETERIQKPEEIVFRMKREVEKNIRSLRDRLKADRDWVIRKRRKIQKAKELTSKMEKELLSPRSRRGR